MFTTEEAVSDLLVGVANGVSSACKRVSGLVVQCTSHCVETTGHNIVSFEINH